LHSSCASIVRRIAEQGHCTWEDLV
jgi:hypothetical protein